MGWKFDNLRFSELVQQKRQASNLGLREAQSQSGISAATIGRIERLELPDMSTFLALVGWIERRPVMFFTNALENSQAVLGSKTQKFKQVVALLAEMGISPERVQALEVVISGLLPVEVSAEAQRQKEGGPLTHYFTASFQVENSQPRTVGLVFKALEGEGDNYNLALLAFAQKSLPAAVRAKGASFSVSLYPEATTSYVLVELRENEQGEPVVTRSAS